MHLNDFVCRSYILFFSGGLWGWGIYFGLLYYCGWFVRALLILYAWAGTLHHATGLRNEHRAKQTCVVGLPRYFLYIIAGPGNYGWRAAYEGTFPGLLRGCAATHVAPARQPHRHLAGHAIPTLLQVLSLRTTLSFFLKSETLVVLCKQLHMVTGHPFCV